MMMSACSSSSCTTPHSLALLPLLVQQLSIEMGSLEVSELGRHVTSSFSGVKVVEELWGSGSAALRCASRLPARFVRRSVMQLVLDMQPHPHVPQYKEASVLFKVGGAGGACWHGHWQLTMCRGDAPGLQAGCHHQPRVWSRRVTASRAVPTLDCSRKCAA